MNRVATALRSSGPHWAASRYRMRVTGRQAFGLLGSVALAGMVGALATHSTSAAVSLIALALLLLFVWYATSFPRGAVILMFASLTLIPVYVVPMYHTFSPEPTAVAALAVAVALAKIGGRVHFTALDLTFLATCGIMVIAALLGPHSLYATTAELFLWVPAYVAGRAVCKRRNGAETIALAAAVAGVLALPLIAYEVVTGSNPFLKLGWPGTELTRLWDHASSRPGGLLRAQGAFGHPLSMAFVIGSCAVFALALSLRASSRLRTIAWLLIALALIAGQYTSHERTGWIVLIGGVLVYALTTVRLRSARLRHVLLVLLVVAPLIIGAVVATQSHNHAAGVARAGSTSDRIELWQHAFEPGSLALLGLPETVKFNHFANAVKPGQTSIDSGFLQVGDVFGLIAFIALFAVVIAVIKTAVAVRGTWAAVLPAVALADFAALTVMGFQTQVPVFAWLIVGGVSGIALRHKARRSQDGFGTGDRLAASAWPSASPGRHHPKRS